VAVTHNDLSFQWVLSDRPLAQLSSERFALRIDADTSLWHLGLSPHTPAEMSAIRLAAGGPQALVAAYLKGLKEADHPHRWAALPYHLPPGCLELSSNLWTGDDAHKRAPTQKGDIIEGCFRLSGAVVVVVVSWSCGRVDIGRGPCSCGWTSGRQTCGWSC
jgi:hypothetical protein